jgi:hypothetical protein
MPWEKLSMSSLDPSAQLEEVEQLASRLREAVPVIP